MIILGEPVQLGFPSFNFALESYWEFSAERGPLTLSQMKCYKPRVLTATNLSFRQQFPWLIRASAI